MNPLLSKIKDQMVTVDSMIFIYAFEQHSTYLPFVRSFFQSLEDGDIRAVTSTITIAECLVVPYRQKDYALAAQYLVLFRNFPHLSTLPVTGEVAERAAFLRAQYNVKTPDAIQLATALVSDAPFFLTNDEALPSIDGIHTLLLSRIA